MTKMFFAYILLSQFLRIWLEKERTETFNYFMKGIEGVRK